MTTSRDKGPAMIAESSDQVPRATLLKDLLLHLPQFISDWKKLRARARRHGLGGSDLILVEFTVP